MFRYLGLPAQLGKLQPTAAGSVDGSKVYVMVANVLNDDVRSSISVPVRASAGESR
ncbi:MAG: hypothetical protein H7222_11805 [Methylotenera sp.]|nr:hypothetical protein [Oligoflexia bacterium]